MNGNSLSTLLCLEGFEEGRFGGFNKRNIPVVRHVFNQSRRGVSARAGNMDSHRYVGYCTCTCLW